MHDVLRLVKHDLHTGSVLRYTGINIVLSFVDVLEAPVRSHAFLPTVHILKCRRTVVTLYAVGREGMYGVRA